MLVQDNVAGFGVFFNPNYAIALPKLAIVLVLWEFAKNLRLTQRLIDDYL